MGELVVLGISGSPRKGNSQYLLTEALDAARQVDPDQVRCISYSLRAKTIGPCLACGHCERHRGDCVTRDDYQELAALWRGADVVIYSVPVYHMGIPGQLKCFIDRLGNTSFSLNRHLLDRDTLAKELKVIGAIAQGCHIHSGQESTLTQLVNHALVMQCIPVAGDMWEAYIGAGGWTSCDTDRRALQKQVATGLSDAEILVRGARNLGVRAVEMALVLRSGAMAHRDRLGRDPVYRPYLERIGVHPNT